MFYLENMLQNLLDKYI